MVELATGDNETVKICLRLQVYFGNATIVRMSEYCVHTGYRPEHNKGFLVVAPPPEGEFADELLAQLSRPPDNKRVYGMTWTDEGMEISVTPVKLEEMYLFRAYVAGKLATGNVVTLPSTITEVTRDHLLGSNG